MAGGFEGGSLSEVVALCEALRAARWTERDVETNPTGSARSRCVVASVVLRYMCVCARCVSQLTSQIIRIPTPVEFARASRHAWQQPRPAQAGSGGSASGERRHARHPTASPPVLATSGGSASQTKHNINPLT